MLLTRSLSLIFVKFYIFLTLKQRMRVSHTNEVAFLRDGKTQTSKIKMPNFRAIGFGKMAGRPLGYRPSDS